MYSNWKERYESELKKPPKKNNLKTELVTISLNDSDQNVTSNIKKLDKNKIDVVTNKAFKYYLQECDIKNNIRNKEKNKLMKKKIKNYIMEINDNFDEFNIETFEFD